MAAERDLNSDEQAVLSATNRWLAATMRSDADALGALVADGFTFTHATTAAADSREEWLESFRAGRRNYQLWAIADLVFQSYPGTVVMTGRARQEIIRPDGQQFDLHTHFTNVWVKVGDAWRLAAWQATQIPEALRGG